MVFYQLCHLSLVIPVLSLAIPGLSLAIPGLSPDIPGLSLIVPSQSQDVPGTFFRSKTACCYCVKSHTYEEKLNTEVNKMHADILGG